MTNGFSWPRFHKNILYPAYITQQDNCYTVQFPDLAEAITEGETLEEAVFQAADVLTLTLEGRIEEGFAIPLPSKLDNAYLIAPSARVQAATSSDRRHCRCLP